MAETSASTKIRTKLNIENLEKINSKDSAAKISNAVCIENMVKKNSMFAPSRLDSMYFEKPMKAIYNLKLIKYKKQIEPHQQTRTTVSNVGKSMASLLNQPKPDVKDPRHRRNISAIWQNKRVSKEKKSQSEQGPAMASFYLKKGDAPVFYELKMDIKKVESQIKPIEGLDTRLGKAKYRNRNFLINKQKIPSKELPQQNNQQNECLEAKKSLEIPYRHEILGQPSPSTMQKYSVPIKAGTNHKERYIKSTLVSYSSKLNFKRNKESVEIVSQLYHVKNIIGFALQTDEDLIDIVEPEIIYCPGFGSGCEEMGSKSANCLSVFHFNNRTQAMKPIFMKDPEKRVEIASITKIMTCFLVLNIARLFRLNIRTEKALVSQRASKMQGTSAGLNYSDILTIYELLHALMLPSGNDAAVALAQWGGKTIRKYCSIAKKYISAKTADAKPVNFINEFAIQKKSHQKLFIYHMNKAATTLKLKNTRFANAHGLMNQKAYSTSNDVALLTCIAMKNADFTQIVGKKEFQCKIVNRTYGQSSNLSWRNTNRLLNTEGFLGVKTGVTPSAGPCLTSMFRLNSNQSMIIVVLKTKSMDFRFKQSLELLKESLKVLNYGTLDSLIGKPVEDDQSTAMSMAEEANLIADQKESNSDQQNDEDEDDQVEQA